MFDHIGLFVSDLEKAKTFYETALAPLGLRCVRSDETYAAFGSATQMGLWLQQGEPVRPRLHIAFAAQTRTQVDNFHKAALAAGGIDNGPPGLRPHYHANYYGAFVLDPDGHNVEAVCRAPA